MEAQPIDLNHLESYSGGDRAFEQEILSLFVSDAQHQIVKIQDAYRCQDVEMLREAAHQLKGASGNIGARTLQRLTAQIETSALSLETLPPLLTELEEAYEAILRQVEALGYSVS